MNKLGKYEIRRELGKGAMGIVYEGFDPMIERRVALKTILPQETGTQRDAQSMNDALARFKREAQAAGRLNHPGIVAVYEYGEDVQEDGKRIAFIAMEYVQGRELRGYFDDQQRFALPEVERIMSEILSALGHAHAHGVIHRDMKPGNLFVMGNGTIKIGDFGIARIESSELTQVGTVMGTPAYMSPEQIVGQTVDQRSDLFSCGVILYQLLTGERPFTGANSTTIMYKVMNEMPSPPSALNLSLPPALDAVIQKALAKAPDQRYQNAQEFQQAITAAIRYTAENDEDKTIIQTQPQTAPSKQADPTTIIRPRENPQAGPAPAPAPAQNASNDAQVQPRPVPPPLQANPVETSGKSKQPMLLAAAALAVCVLAGGGYYLLHKPADSNVIANAPNTESSASKQAKVEAQPASQPVDVYEAGQIVVSALGMANPQDPQFHGDVGEAQAAARADAKRQLVEKVAALYVNGDSLDKNYPLIKERVLANYADYIQNVITESAPQTSKNGLLETEARAVLKIRAVQKSLNQLSKEERIEFIRNHGDPKIAIQMAISNVDTAQILPGARSQLAENVLKERIKSFGFRIWANDHEGNQKAKMADFQIIGEAKFKLLSAKLPASGLTITKTVLTSWTVKAVDKSTNEEIYLNTVMPKGQSWASEDLALADIGKQMGDEFSKEFFLQHLDYGVNKTMLKVQGLPDAQTAQLLLRELRGVREIIDVQMLGPVGNYQLQVPQGSSSDLLQEKLLKPLNAKLGQSCFALGASSEHEVNLQFAQSCQDALIRGKFENSAPAGLLDAPDERRKALSVNGKLAT